MQPLASGAVVGTAIVLGAACAKSEGPRVRKCGHEVFAEAPSATVPAENAVGDAGLPALANAEWLERLDLSDGDVALVSVPLGATEPRPVMVAAHGAGDRPEWACGGWRGVTDAYPFIVCPRGTPTKDGASYWRSTAQLDHLTERAVVALRARFGAYVSEAPMLYAGFSAGAIYGAAMVRDKAAQFPMLMLSEGGYDQLTDPTFATRFQRNGGRRVLFGCSTGAGCVAKLSEARDLLERAGVEARVNDAGRLGHNLNREVVSSLRRDWPWLVRGREGWSSYPAGNRTPRVSPIDAGGAEAPAVVTAVEVPGDLPAFFLAGAKETHRGIVFLTGACTHPQGYLQSFQFAARERGAMLGPQGDAACGGPYRHWTFDLAKQNARIEAGFEAAGSATAERLKDMVLIGYSQGALLAEVLAEKYPERYTRVILIGSPTEPSALRLRRVRAAVMIAGEYDATGRMKAGARTLVAAGIPATYIEMPKARHGQMVDAERLMARALEWVLTHGQ